MSPDLSDLLRQAEEGYGIPCHDERGGVDIWARSSCGDTLLHVAVGRQSIDEIRYLVEQGLDIDAKGDYLETLL